MKFLALNWWRLSPICLCWHLSCLGTANRQTHYLTLCCGDKAAARCGNRSPAAQHCCYHGPPSGRSRSVWSYVGCSCELWQFGLVLWIWEIYWASLCWSLGLWCAGVQCVHSDPGGTVGRRGAGISVGSLSVAPPPRPFTPPHPDSTLHCKAEQTLTFNKLLNYCKLFPLKTWLQFFPVKIELIVCNCFCFL